jgi:hypothetical protein
MEKSLQQQYNLIKEGKGNKDDFLKNARRVFPEFISPLTDYNTAITILKGKSVLYEGIGGVVSTGTTSKNWFKIFNENIAEAIGVKDKKEYGDQNTFEKIDKDVTKDLDNQFNNKDPKNIDNLYGQSFLLGFMTEMHDPKNAKKTVDELKAIVAKNMAKDINYYHINASFGVKGIGYTKDSVGMGEPVAPKGKYKSSGYGDLKESINEIGMFLDPTGYDSNRKSQMQLAREILADAGMPKEEIEAFISNNMFRPGRLSDKAREYVSSMELNTKEGKLKESIKDFFKK